MELVREKVKPKKQKKKAELKKSEAVKETSKAIQKEQTKEVCFEPSGENDELGQDLKIDISDYDSSKTLQLGNKTLSEDSILKESSQRECLENLISNDLKNEIQMNESFVSSSENNNLQGSQLEKLKNTEPKEERERESKCLSVVPESLSQNVSASEIKVFSNIVNTNHKVLCFAERSVNSNDERTVVKNVYPDLKSIQYCEKIEDIASIQTLVRTYTDEYINKTFIEANKKCHEFHLALTSMEKYPLFDLIKEYQNARKKSSEARNRMKYLNSKLNLQKDKLWKLLKKEISSKGQCQDGYNVAISHFYYVKELDEDVFHEIIEILRELEEITLSDAYYSYSDQLSELKIEQYIFNMMNYLDMSDITGQENTSTSDNMKIDILKKCISILFHYQRQSIKDKEFLEIGQKWLTILVSMLLENGTHADYLFILNHIIRCPNGIQTWASQLIQLPLSALCSKGIVDTFNCQCLYYALLVLYLIVNPAPDRDNFLKNVKSAYSCIDSCEGDFTMLDSEGEEEEVFEVVKNWTNDDIVSLLNQIPIARMYEHILIDNRDGKMNIKCPSKDRILKMFAFSTALINVLFSGLGNFCNEEYITSIECICSMIRHAVCYVSDHWIYCSDLDISSKSALQAEYDRFIFHVVFSIYNFQALGIWKFLSTLPYKCVSRKMLWNIMWIFHSPSTFEDNIYLAKDIDLKLQDAHMISVFVEKLKMVKQCNQVYLLNVYKSIVLCGTGEEELISFIVHEVFEVVFIESSLRDLSKEGSVVLMCIIKKYPPLLTVLLKEVQQNEDDDVINFSIPMFEELNLKEWVPKPEDIRIITDWLLTNSLASPKNYLARILLTKMNWDFSADGETILPIELHREIAIFVLQAYMKFDSKGNEWSVSNGLTQMLQFATVGSFAREDEGFVPWAWDLLFSLKLHALDRKYPPWVQIYDGFLEVDFLPDPFEEVWLQPLLYGYEERHPVACYLFLVMTNIGHNVRRLMNEGLKCLTALIKHQQYLAAIQSLYYILPFFVKSSEELLSQSQFISIMSDLIIADMSVLSSIKGAMVGAVLHKIAAMIKHQISQACSVTIECATPLLKLWVNILLKILAVRDNKNYNLKDSAKQIHFLLDVIVKISFIDIYTRNGMIDFLYSFGNPLLTSSSVQTSFWRKFFSANADSYTILKKQTFPEYPWLAWFILQSEIKQKHLQDLWYQIQKEMSIDDDMSPSAALKKACSFLKIPPPLLETLPIYRWCLQILETPVSHPALPLMFQQFFYYYFERKTLSDSQMPKSMGLKYFKSGTHLLMLKKLKTKAQDTAEFYRKGLQPSNNTPVQAKEALLSVASIYETETKVVTRESIFNFELCKVFRAFCLWIDDTHLLLPNLCFSALDPKYCSERLKLVLDNDQRDWYELVSVERLKDDLDQKVHLWERKKKYSFTNECAIESHDKSLCERIENHLSTDTVKPLPSDMNVDPPIREIEDVALSSWSVLVKLIESYQSIIFDKANSFTELATKLKQLNYNYKNCVPQEFFKEEHWETHTKTCHKGSGCSGPATFRLQIQQYVTNQRIREKIESNRTDHHIVQKQLLNLPVSQLCSASVHIENYIRALSKKLMSTKGEEGLKFRNMGVSLFYLQIEKVNEVITSVKNYTPSRNFFSTSLESLGNAFILDQESQLYSLAKAILTYPEAGELIFDLFNPNIASIKVFLDVYEVITSSVQKCSPVAIFVLLNKIDLQRILKEKGANFCDRRKLFKGICEAILQCGSNPPDEFQMMHDVLRRHFRITLKFTFPEFYEDAVSFLLEGMETGRLSISVWYEAFNCFGCSTLHDRSSIPEIESALKKFAENLLLPPDQQIFVSSQPTINVNEVVGTLNRLYHKFMEKRNYQNLYQVFQIHVKPFGIFVALLSHSLLSFLNENVDHKQVLNISQLWESLHLAFYAWLHPFKSETGLVFPWSDKQINDARLMFQIFTISLNNFHENLLGYNCEKCILSYTWSSYVDVYVTSGLRHYSVSLCHSELYSLPWEQFHPDSKDLEGMCKVLQSNLPESREFLAKISLRIPWIEVMKSISETKSPEYVRQTLSTLGKLLIVSGMDVSLTKSNLHQNNLKALEELSWHFLSLEDTEGLLDLYYSTFDPNTLLNEEFQNKPDVYILQFLKIVCCMAVSPSTFDHASSNPKRLLYLRKYITALNLCISTENEIIFKNPEKWKKILPSLFTDIEQIISKVVQPDQQMCKALPLVREAIGFLNNISDPKLENIVIHSVLSWLRANPRSPLLLPCLQTACQCLNQMTNAVMIVECCITTRFNTDNHDPSDANAIWQLILLSFQVPASMTDEFVHACVNKNAFLTLYCYVLEKMPKTTSESKKLLLINIIEWIKKCEIKESDEAKCLLLWDKVLELSITLAFEDNLQVVKRALSAFCNEISLHGEDKSSDGFLAAVGFGRTSNLSVNFRFLCRMIVAYLLLQMPFNASLRLEAMAPGYLPITDIKTNTGVNPKLSKPSPSTSALKAVENLKSLLKNKPYSALRDLVNSAIEFVLDPKHSLNESRFLLKEYALLVFPKQNYLYALA